MKNQKQLNKFIAFLFCIMLLLYENAYAQSFNPQIKTYDGYVIDLLDFRGDKCYSFSVFSKELTKNIDFVVNKKDGSIILKDTSLLIVFWGSYYPKPLHNEYHNLTLREWLRSIPKFSKEIKIRRKCYIYPQKVRFEAFEYNEYKTVEGTVGYPNLINWGIYGDCICLPQHIKSNNKWIIVNNWIDSGNVP